MDFPHTLVEWSRLHFGMTALFHFLFVPLTLGLSFLCAFFETIYVGTGNVVWKQITKFWIVLFAINFAVGASTGIILEFEFGTNWANYSWAVGDIFGAPLAVEGLAAFFLETTFFIVMFFGWERVSKRFHLVSTWLVAVGSNLSAYWILVANGWMQHPVGTHFNIESSRNEMISFLDVALSPVGVSKFLHTLASSYIISALFVIGVSSYLLLRVKRDRILARRSLIVGASFGLLACFFTILTGDDEGYRVSQTQPVKLAAMEGLYDGSSRAGIVAFGILNSKKNWNNNEPSFLYKIELPAALSLLGHHDVDAFVPGITDLLNGNSAHKILPVKNKIESGQKALKAKHDFLIAKKTNDKIGMSRATSIFDKYSHYLGYAQIKHLDDLIPNVPVIFYSFHLMVGLGFYFVFLFLVVLYLGMVNEIHRSKKILWLCILSVPLGYLASELGWIVAEMGRQPWAIQDLLLTKQAASNLKTSTVQITLGLFFVLFLALIIVELRIMMNKIKKGF